MKERIKAREISGPDNNQYAIMDFFESDNRLKCPECGCLLDPYYRSLRIKFNSKFDFSSTYDGVFIVSKRFKDYLQAEGYINVIFYPVNEENVFFYFLVLNNQIKVDVKKSGVEFKEKCNNCKYPREVIGGFDIFIEQEAPLADGFYSTDIYWRTHNRYGYKIFIGQETYDKLKAQKFKGLDMARKIY